MGSTAEPQEIVYKSANGAELKLHLFDDADRDRGTPLPAIVFFFGGGWVGGDPKQFFPHCEYFASRGMVAITAEYRVQSRHGTTPFESAADGKSAVRWVRSHASDLGIDPHRLAAGGGSAGGQLAACTGWISGLDDLDEDPDVSSRPDALVLFNPAVDLLSIGTADHGAAGLSDEEKRTLSPTYHVRSGLPPTIIFHGLADTTIPIGSIETFCERMTEAGNACELVPFEGKAHGFFNHGRDGNVAFTETVRLADRFLASLGYLTGDPTI